MFIIVPAQHAAADKEPEFFRHSGLQQIFYLTVNNFRVVDQAPGETTGLLINADAIRMREHCQNLIFRNQFIRPFENLLFQIQICIDP